MKAKMMSLFSPQPGEGFVSSQNSSLCSKQQSFSPQSRGVWLSQAPRGGLLSQAVLSWREASSGRQLPGMLPGRMWGWNLCYLLALTTLQLSMASKGTLQLQPGHPLTAHSQGREHSRRFMEQSLVCSPLFIHNLHSIKFLH